MMKRILGAWVGCLIATAALGQAQVGPGNVLGNTTATRAPAADSSVTLILDRAFGSTRGSILRRGASGWNIVGPSATVGLPWVSAGTGADPLYQVLTIAGGGTGQTTQQAAFDALGPTATRAGDVTYWNGTHYVNLAGNNSGTKVFTEDSSGNPTWAIGGVSSASDLLQNGTLVATKDGSNNLTVALKTLAGADPSVGSPVTTCFRNATIATGDYTCVSATAATSITVNAGSTFGVSNNTPFHLWVGLFNDAGTLRLGLFQSASAGAIASIDMYNVKSSTACAACSTATAAGVWYTPVAVSSKAFRLAGQLEWSSGLATAGTFASVPTKIQLYHPGIPLPGTPVQVVSNVYNEGTTQSATTHTNTVVDGIPSTARLQVGMDVHRTNFAANTLITQITSSVAIAVSPATTGSATNPMTCSWVAANATTTFANGPMSASITLTSPAHSVAINYCMGTVASAASVEAFTSVSRGGVQVLPTFSGAFSTAGVAVAPSCGAGSELPGSVGPFTYNFIFKSSAATSVSVCDNNGGCSYTISEVAQ